MTSNKQKFKELLKAEFTNNNSIDKDAEKNIDEIVNYLTNVYFPDSEEEN